MNLLDHFHARFSSIATGDETDTSVMLLNVFTPVKFPTTGKFLFLFTIWELRVWSCSSAVFSQGHTQANVSLMESSRFVRYMSCAKSNPSALAEYRVTAPHRSSKTANQNLLGTYKVMKDRAELFFNDFLVPNSTVSKTHWSQFKY